MEGTTRSDRGTDQSLGKHLRTLQNDYAETSHRLYSLQLEIADVKEELRRSRREESQSTNDQGTAGKGPEGDDKHAIPLQPGINIFTYGPDGTRVITEHHELRLIETHNGYRPHCPCGWTTFTQDGDKITDLYTQHLPNPHTNKSTTKPPPNE